MRRNRSAKRKESSETPGDFCLEVLFSLEPQPQPRSHNARLDTTHSSAPLGLAMEKVKTACGNILECFWRQSWEKGRPVTRQDSVLLLLWLLCEYPALSHQQTETWGALKTSPGWPSRTETLASHRLLSAGVASLPPRLPHPHSRVANGVAREPLSAASKQRSHWPTCRRASRALGLELRGTVSPTCFQASAGFQPCDNCSSLPPLCHYRGSHSFIDPSRPDDARG
jgi:hypothetical protein